MDLSFRLLMLLMTYAVGKDKCWPSISELSKQVGKCKSQIIIGLKRLESSGYIAKEKSNGKTTTYKLLDKRPVWNSKPVDADQYGNPNWGGVENHTGPVWKTKHGKREKKYIKEIDPASSSTRRKTAPKGRSQIQQHLLSLDVGKHRTKWADKINFNDALESFKEVALNGTAQKPGPNPYDWKDFGLALDQWCRKRNGWQSQPALRDNQAISDYPQLTDYQY